MLKYATFLRQNYPTHKSNDKSIFWREIFDRNVCVRIDIWFKYLLTNLKSLQNKEKTFEHKHSLCFRSTKYVCT